MQKGRRYETVSFISDFGVVDEFVGVVHSVINSISPHARIIDITHGVPPYDIRSGGLALARSAQYLSPGVVLAVVDPGIGTDRRAVAVEVGNGESVLVGPDNGLLAPAVALVGGASRAVSLTEKSYQLEAPGPLFAGRDVFAPAAAHLASGVDIMELGDVIETESLIPGMIPIMTNEDGGINTEVLWVDRYGNAQINLGPDELAKIDAQEGWYQIKTVNQSRAARKVTVFAELPPGGLVLTIDSYGLITLVVGRGSAAEELNLNPGDQLFISKGETPNSSSSPVTLGKPTNPLSGDN